MSQQLNAKQRATDLDQLAHGGGVDVLVVGGGVTGAGAALDAASRGLSVALVERHDLAFGTSRWSSKLVHGGLRYLAQGAWGIALESARERDVLLRRTAPHLVRPLPVCVPFHDRPNRQAEALVQVGFKLGDGLRRAAGTPASLLPRSRRITPQEALHLAPGLRRDGLRGAALAWDAQLEDDARLVVALARTAAHHGARVLTRVDCETAGDGLARLHDLVSGQRFELRAKVVVNATGVWAPSLEPSLELRPSRGSHLVVPLDALGGLRSTINVAVPGAANRYVFAIPQPTGYAYVGLTDVPVEDVEDVPAAPDEDVDFLLGTLAAALEHPLTRADVAGTYAGLRPLVAGEAEQTADLSRSHAVLTSTPGVVSIVGGKLTTYRQMAEDAIDAAVTTAGLRAGRVRTRTLPLVGAATPGELAKVPAPAPLVARYGTEAPYVAALDPDPLAAQLKFALRHEGALDVGDLLDRRTRLGLVPADRAAAVGLAERLVEEELGAPVAVA